MKRATAARAALGVLLLALLVYLGRRYFDRLRLILTVRASTVVALFCLYTLARAIQGEVYRTALRVLGLSVGPYEGFKLAMLVNLGNLVLPRAGPGAAAVYLKRRHSFAYAGFASLFLTVLVLQFTCGSILGLASMGWLSAFSGYRWSWPLAGILTGIAVGSPLVLVVPAWFRPKWRGRAGSFVRRALLALSILRGHRAMIARILALRTAALVVMSLQLWLCLLAIGAPTPFPAALVLCFLGLLGMRLGPTPGGLGFREGAITLAGEFLRLDPSLALAAAVLDRAVATAATLVVGQLALWPFLRLPGKQQGRPTLTPPAGPPPHEP